jgi:Abortive infection alpha
MPDTGRMSEDLVQAAKAAAELEPAIEAFAEATGALGPVRESTGWLGDVIRARREAHLAKVLMKAAEKIKASGLPPHAVRDKLLRAVVEDGSMEDDPSMQERWANLLANAATSGAASVRAAFPGILSELEPDEAALLDEFADRASEKSFRDKKFSPEEPGYGGPRPGLDNLHRLGLVVYGRNIPTTMGGASDEGATITGVRFTKFGWDFAQACRQPRTDDAQGRAIG